MLKVLIIIFVIGYLLYKVGGFIFKILLGVNNMQQPRPQPRKTPGSNVDINEAKPNAKEDFKGGEYIDYEEVE
ncbi:MAG: hypothetical protein OEX02_05170 [Cyclobacteriaceae bacterium]|nr:hypothetical protein [Cyclobacteriaceae bacterium]